ncbi:MAG: hypothetical protein JXA68_11070 [Ignavibacteriales bacterium]|nr:hypothetical protein [Ignavibacteriales bacterium]
MINKNKLEYFLFIILVKIVNLFGFSRIKYLAKFFGLIFFYFIPIRKKIVIANLKIAFPEKNKKDIKKLTLQNYISFFATLFEIMSIPKLSKEKILSLVEWGNIEIFSGIFRRNKGIFLLTAHIGNWELSAIAASLFLKKKFFVLAKQQRNQYFSDWLNKMRKTFGNKVIPLGMSVRDIYIALKEKNIVGVVGDQRGPKDGLRVKLFNKDTSVYEGTAEIALKLNIPIVAAMTIRKQDYSFKVIFEEIKYNTYSNDNNEKIIKINQEYMNILERTIREYPSQWFWMHKIWKY